MHPGTLLMRFRNAADCQDKRVPADVAVPQVASDRRLHCQFLAIWAKVRAGRTQAVYFLQRRLWGNTTPAVQEYWSRGCRRAHVSFSVFACWPLWLHAPRKKSPLLLWKSRYQPSLPTQASTSDLGWRAGRDTPHRHAMFSDGHPQKTTTPINPPKTSKTFKVTPIILARGLSACANLMLLMAAVPTPKDRSLC